MKNLNILKNTIKEELNKLKKSNPKALQPLNEGWVYYCDCPGYGKICDKPCESCAQGCKPYGPGEYEPDRSIQVGRGGKIVVPTYKNR